MLEQWWVWGAAAVILMIVETLVPGYVFLGFAIGAALVSLLTLAGVTGGMGLPVLLLIFALASLIAWIAMRRFFGIKGGSVRRFDHDINKD